MACLHPSRFLKPAALALAALLSTGADLRAQSLCSKPVTPICATRIPAADPAPATEKPVARHRCIEDAGTYRERMQEYRQCLQGSVDEAERSLKAADAFIACLERGTVECHLDGAR